MRKQATSWQKASVLYADLKRDATFMSHDSGRGKTRSSGGVLTTNARSRNNGRFQV